jgi:hypothetical protein
MTERFGTHHPQRINQYVPLMAYDAGVVHRGPNRVSLGAPIAADPNGIVAAFQMVNGSAHALTRSDFEAATYLDVEGNEGTMGRYGRCVVIDASAANTRVATIIGRDYLGQPMEENITFNGTTAVEGAKAFKYIDAINITSSTDVTTVDIGFIDELGLPYQAIDMLADYEDNVIAAGTFAAAVLTDPQTATTGDPRGTLVPATSCDGSIEYDVVLIYGIDNLHGVQHFIT